MIEKPKTNQSNSNLAIVGRYVLLPSVFEYLEKTLPGANNEIQLTDAISSMIPIIKTHAFLFDGNHQLVYRGQFDSSRPDSGIPVTGEDLRQAVDAMLAGQPVSEDQKPSLGCNIKWKEEQAPDYFNPAGVS